MSKNNVVPFPNKSRPNSELPWDHPAVRKLLMAALPFMDWEDNRMDFSHLPAVRCCPLCRGDGIVPEVKCDPPA